jgi:hypothetical protein
MEGIGLIFFVALGFVPALVQQASAQADLLPSWNDGAAKKSIVELVAKVSPKSWPDYVRPAERIAAFDNNNDTERVNKVFLGLKIPFGHH